VAKSYVLDTSALFTLTKGEDGSDTVEDILISAKKGKCHVYLSFISFAELYYITWQEKGESAAKELIILVKSLPAQTKTEGFFEDCAKSCRNYTPTRKSCEGILWHFQRGFITDKSTAEGSKGGKKKKQ
jgi:hypothetical protein